MKPSNDADDFKNMRQPTSEGIKVLGPVPDETSHERLWKARLEAEIKTGAIGAPY
jgi:hypothetical protein